VVCCVWELGKEVGKEGSWASNDFDFHCPNLTDYRAKSHEVGSLARTNTEL